MEEKNININKGSVGFCGLLTLVFIVLKLVGVISWSWVWVLAPLWIEIILVFVIVFICTLIALLVNRR